MPSLCFSFLLSNLSSPEILNSYLINLSCLCCWWELKLHGLTLPTGSMFSRTTYGFFTGECWCAERFCCCSLWTWYLDTLEKLWVQNLEGIWKDSKFGNQGTEMWKIVGIGVSMYKCLGMQLRWVYFRTVGSLFMQQEQRTREPESRLDW